MFGHSSSVLPLECLLGLNKFSSFLPILADNYAQQGERAYRGSRIDPKAADVAFVLYECDQGLQTFLFAPRKLTCEFFRTDFERSFPYHFF